MSGEKETGTASWTTAHPDLFKKPLDHLARIAVEFEYHLRDRDSEDFLHGDSPSRVYWIVKLGRIAMRRDGRWAYLEDARHCSTKRQFGKIREQRFVSFNEAVRVATSVFGAEPEHAAYMRKYAMELEQNQKETTSG